MTPETHLANPSREAPLGLVATLVAWLFVAAAPLAAGAQSTPPVPPSAPAPSAAPAAPAPPARSPSLDAINEAANKAAAAALAVPGSSSRTVTTTTHSETGPDGTRTHVTIHDSDDDTADEADAAAASAQAGKGHGVGIVVGKNGRVDVSGMGRHREFESFDELADQAPWIPALVFFSVALVFLVPLVVIVLIFWYKMRKARMINDTLLRFAERGVTPPPEAFAAMGIDVPVAATFATPASAAPSAPAAAAAPAAAPGVTAAAVSAVRGARIWSDLRKGVVMATLGFGIQAWSLFDGNGASLWGLILLFLGTGYIVLWYFEDRRQPLPPVPGAGV